MAGVVKGHRQDSGELFYCIEKEGQRKWYRRTAVILSLEQGNRLREQFGLSPFEPSAPLTKAADISLGMGGGTLGLRRGGEGRGWRRPWLTQSDSAVQEEERLRWLLAARELGGGGWLGRSGQIAAASGSPLSISPTAWQWLVGLQPCPPAALPVGLALFLAQAGAESVWPDCSLWGA